MTTIRNWHHGAGTFLESFFSMFQTPQLSSFIVVTVESHSRDSLWADPRNLLNKVSFPRGFQLCVNCLLTFANNNICRIVYVNEPFILSLLNLTSREKVTGLDCDGFEYTLSMTLASPPFPFMSFR
jgi:hypothetical protein